MQTVPSDTPLSLLFGRGLGTCCGSLISSIDIQYINLRMTYVTHISARGACVSEKLKGDYGVNMELLAFAIHLSLTLVYC